MRFGGHQTFYIREGWLYKGLELLLNNPELLSDEYSFDYLGVGKNMASSIYHWLLATGLAEKRESTTGKRDNVLAATSLAHRIWAYDKYLSSITTWWILHINLIHNREHAETWYWFFNKLGMDRFDRETCLRRMQRYLKDEYVGKVPKLKTVERDISCLLNTYSVEIPARSTDPEEDIWCPFRDLGILTHYRSSGQLQVNRQRKDIPNSVVMYAIEKSLSAFEDCNTKQNSEADIRFFDLVRTDGNPLRAFLLSNDTLFEKLLNIEVNNPEYGLRIVGLAGDRQIRIPRRSVITWIDHAYEEERVKT